MTSADGTVRINQAPVLTLWAAVVAEPVMRDCLKRDGVRLAHLLDQTLGE
jgi:hypothetical protein